MKEPNQIEPSEPKTTINYGSIIRISHLNSKKYLNSPLRPYIHPGTSSQTQVTANSIKERSSLWIVKGPHNTVFPYKYGSPVRKGDTIRLENYQSKENLHSHKDRVSPMLKQKEVTTFGQNGVGDLQDEWEVNFTEKDWQQSEIFQLKHKFTSSYLHSLGGVFDPSYTSGQQVVSCKDEVDANCDWIVDDTLDPIYISPINELTSTITQLLQDSTKVKVLPLLNTAGSIASFTGITLLLMFRSITSAIIYDITAMVLALFIIIGILMFLLILFKSLMAKSATIYSKIGTGFLFLTVSLVVLVLVWFLVYRSLMYLISLLL